MEFMIFGHLINMKKLLFVLLILPMYNCVCIENSKAISQPQPNYLLSIASKNEWLSVVGQPLSDKFGNTESVKVILDLSNSKLYFISGIKYKFHFDFCVQQLNTFNDLATFNVRNYGASAQRDFVLANINYYTSCNKYALEFFCGDEVTTSQVKLIYEALLKTTFFGNQIKLYLNSNEFKEKNWEGIIPTINTEEIYKGQKYFALTKGQSFGYLRIISDSNATALQYNRTDILVLNQLPNQIGAVAGIITVPIQTPLSHIALLCQNRKTPNCTYTKAIQENKLKLLEGKLVQLVVGQDSLEIKPATLADATQFWKLNTPSGIRQLDAKLEATSIIAINKLGRKNVNLVGGKASQMAELHKIMTADNAPINLPEAAYAIPFYYYNQHIKNNNIQPLIESLLIDTVFKIDKNKLENQLQKIRTAIKTAPIDSNLINQLKTALKNYPYQKYRFRSSTNAEDIEGFNGAGLYQSKTGNINEEKSFEKAIKLVWASLWNSRAWEERSYFKIDQRTVYMGVLVHRAFGTEKANGVAITRNPYRKGQYAFFVNAQIGETSVVFPPKNVECDQFIINVGWAAINEKTIIELIAKSSINNNVPVLNAKQQAQLGSYLMAIHEHYYNKLNIAWRKNGELFAMDVEFKIDAQSGNLYIKQARELTVAN
jgi:pyruvate,water dikinase